MEQTLGKRIATHRKRLGLTQDALAEQLGITAQAVSKWENDLSCPDITMLPRLAEIFGITTDALLGHEAGETVHEAEVVHDHEEDDEGLCGIHFENNTGNSWNFHWDSGRRHGLLTALTVLWIGGLLLLSKFMGWDVSFGGILWPSLLIFFGISGTIRNFSAFRIGCFLFGGYFLVSNLGLWKLEIAGELIFPICVVLFGLGLLIDAMRKPKKPKFRITKQTNRQKNRSCDCKNDGHHFQCELNFGQKTHLVDVPRLESGNADLCFGEMTVDLSQVGSVASDCVITANCAFGELTFLVPRKYRMVCNNSTAFGNISIQGSPDSESEDVIELEASVSFGQICVQYI